MSKLQRNDRRNVLIPRVVLPIRLASGVRVTVVDSVSLREAGTQKRGHTVSARTRDDRKVKTMTLRWILCVVLLLTSSGCKRSIDLTKNDLAESEKKAVHDLAYQICNIACGCTDPTVPALLPETIVMPLPYLEGKKLDRDIEHLGFLGFQPTSESRRQIVRERIACLSETMSSVFEDEQGEMRSARIERYNITFPEPNLAESPQPFGVAVLFVPLEVRLGKGTAEGQSIAYDELVSTLREAGLYPENTAPAK